VPYILLPVSIKTETNPIRRHYMKRIALLAVIGLWAVLYTGCSDSGTNSGGIHDTLYISDTTGEMAWNITPGLGFTLGYEEEIFSLVRGSNLFVAVACIPWSDGNGYVFTSSDGITWTAQASGTTSHGLRAVTWAQSTYVAVGDSGTIITSPDGITWTGQASGTYNYLFGLVYGSNKFLACGFDSIVVTSSDGLSWTADTANISIVTGLYPSIAYGNNRFVLVRGEDDSILYTSTDGLTWTNTGIMSDYAKVLWADSQFVLWDNTGIFTSPDGLAWTSRVALRYSGIKRNAGAWGNGKFVLTIGSWNLSSLDGAVWQLEDSFPLTTYSWFLAYGAGKFVAVHSYGTVLSSDW
jgi:hypothetical protein